MAAYCQERNNGIDPHTFVDYNEARGWKIGGAPMKDWKAGIRYWEQRRRDKDKTEPVKRADINYGRVEDYGYVGSASGDE